MSLTHRLLLAAKASLAVLLLGEIPEPRATAPRG